MFREAEEGRTHTTMDTPGSCVAIGVCLAVWFKLWNSRVEFEAVAMSYRKVVVDGEVWRALTSTLAHLDVMHVVMNVMGLWSCRDIEASLGTFFYFKHTVILMVR